MALETTPRSRGEVSECMDGVLSQRTKHTASPGLMGFQFGHVILDCKERSPTSLCRAGTHCPSAQLLECLDHLLVQDYAPSGQRSDTVIVLQSGGRTGGENHLRAQGGQGKQGEKSSRRLIKLALPLSPVVQ